MPDKGIFSIMSPVVIVLAPFVLPILIIIIVKEIINQVKDSQEKKRRRFPLDQSFTPFKF